MQTWYQEQVLAVCVLYLRVMSAYCVYVLCLRVAILEKQFVLGKYVYVLLLALDLRLRFVLGCWYQLGFVRKGTCILSLVGKYVWFQTPFPGLRVYKAPCNAAWCLVTF